MSVAYFVIVCARRGTSVDRFEHKAVRLTGVQATIRSITKQARGLIIRTTLRQNWLSTCGTSEQGGRQFRALGSFNAACNAHVMTASRLCYGHTDVPPFKLLSLDSHAGAEHVVYLMYSASRNLLTGSAIDHLTVYGCSLIRSMS